MEESPHSGEIQFLTGPIMREGHQALAEIILDRRHQGWLGVPHGGILMALALELVHHGFGDPLFVPEHFPIHASFRWGGPTVSLGKPLILSARQEAAATHVVEIKKDSATSASFTARIRRAPVAGTIEVDCLDKLTEALEGVGRETKDRVLPLPSASDCFVCGTDRPHPGLARRFYCLEAGEMQVAFTSIGVDPEDQVLLSRFCLEHAQVHPGILAAVLDETMGWGGFLKARAGGMTVKLDVDFLQPAEPDEKMVCFGVCSGIRGRTPTRMFWFSEGGVVPMGEPERALIVRAKGQWLAVPSLTEEMKEHLRPSAWLDRWIAREGA